MKLKLYTTDIKSESNRNSKECYTNKLEHNTSEYISSCYSSCSYLSCNMKGVTEGEHTITRVK